jgi:hypothetical protein
MYKDRGELSGEGGGRVGGGDFRRQKCMELFDDYGIPVGYSCITMSASVVPMEPATTQIIDDDIFNELVKNSNAAYDIPRNEIPRTWVMESRTPRHTKKKRVASSSSPHSKTKRRGKK